MNSKKSVVIEVLEAKQYDPALTRVVLLGEFELGLDRAAVTPEIAANIQASTLSPKKHKMNDEIRC